VRIPTVSVRPGKANAAASSFASAVIREPLNGHRLRLPGFREDAECGCARRARWWANLIRAFELPTEAWGPIRSINLPGITVSVTQMIASLKKLGGDKAAARVSIAVDPRIDAIVADLGGAPGHAACRQKWDLPPTPAWTRSSPSTSPTRK